MLRLPVRGGRARWVAIGYGIVLFLWLEPEDDAVWPAALLGAGLSALLVVFWVLGRFGGKTVSRRTVVSGALALGAVGGFGAAIMTTVLMFFKNARHAHLYPDYPPEQMGAMLQRGPVWALAGALFGLGLALAWLALRGDRHGDE